MISNLLVKLLNADETKRIKVKSELHKGTEFYFTIPRVNLLHSKSNTAIELNASYYPPSKNEIYVNSMPFDHEEAEMEEFRVVV